MSINIKMFELTLQVLKDKRIKEESSNFTKTLNTLVKMDLTKEDREFVSVSAKYLAEHEDEVPAEKVARGILELRNKYVYKGSFASSLVCEETAKIKSDIFRLTIFYFKRVANYLIKELNNGAEFSAQQKVFLKEASVDQKIDYSKFINCFKFDCKENPDFLKLVHLLDYSKKIKNIDDMNDVDFNTAKAIVQIRNQHISRL